MDIAVFGATGGTGQEVVRQALAQGDNVTAFVRDPARMPIKNDRLRLVVGDVLDPTRVDEAVAGQNAVVVSLGSQERSNRTLRSEGTANVIRSMEAHGVPRLVVVSAGGTGDSYEELPLAFKALVRTVLRNAYIDHEKQEEHVRASKLDWVIVRPAGLTNDPSTGRYHNGPPQSAERGAQVSRADLADLVVQQLTDDRYLRKALSIP